MPTFSPDPSFICLDQRLVGEFVSKINGNLWVPEAATAIGSVRNGKLVGGVTYERNYIGGSVVIHSGGIGKYWCTRHFLHYVFHYPFVQLGACKLLGFVDSNNIAAIRFNEHIGFMREHTIEGAGRNGSDLIVYSMTLANCKWIGKTDEQTRHPSDARLHRSS